MMSDTPTTWHTRTAAQALIGLIAAAGHQPKTRPGSPYPDSPDARYYDCPEFEQLAQVQQEALTEALNAGDRAFREGAERAEAYADFETLARQDLADLITAEIVARRQAVAA